MDTGTLLLLGAAALALLTKGTGPTPSTGGVIGGTPGVIPGTVLPPGGSTTPVVVGGGAGTPNPTPVAVNAGGTAAAAGGGVPTGGGALSLVQIGKIASSAMKELAALFRKVQEGSLAPSAPLTMGLDAETRAAWDSYRAGEWHVEANGVLVVDDVGAPVLNAGFASLPSPAIRDVPLLVPSDFMLLNDHAAVSGLAPGWTGVDLDLAFTAETTQDMIGQMAHEEMRAYIDALPADQALQFVDDAAGLTGYTRLNVLDGLQALGLLAGTLAVYKGVAQGSPISILGGVTAVISNFGVVAKVSNFAFGTPLLNGSLAAGLGILSGIIGIAAAIQGDNIFGVISGTIGVITGVVNLAATTGLISTASITLGVGTAVNLSGVAVTAAFTVLEVLAVATVVVAIAGFFYSQSLAHDAEQVVAEAHEYRTIMKDMAVAWPQLVAGHKAALLLQFVYVLPPQRHVEALRAIFLAGHIGIGAGAAIAKFMAAAGSGQFGTGDVSRFAAVLPTLNADTIIGTMRSAAALMRLGVQAEPQFYPLWEDPEQFLFWFAWGMNATAVVAVAVTADPNVTPDVGPILYNTEYRTMIPGIYGSPALLDPIFPPLQVPVCVQWTTEWQSIGVEAVPVQVCVRTGLRPVPGSGFRANVWAGNAEEMVMAVIKYYNPTGWASTILGQRLQFIGTYPVPLSPTDEVAMKLQYEYWAAVLAAVPGGGIGEIPDPWYDPRFVVPPRSQWPAPAPGYVDPTSIPFADWAAN
jgi:hypothetical protein